MERIWKECMICTVIITDATSPNGDGASVITMVLLFTQIYVNKSFSEGERLFPYNIKNNPQKSCTLSTITHKKKSTKI